MFANAFLLLRVLPLLLLVACLQAPTSESVGTNESPEIALFDQPIGDTLLLEPSGFYCFYAHGDSVKDLTVNWQFGIQFSVLDSFCILGSSLLSTPTQIMMSVKDSQGYQISKQSWIIRNSRPVFTSKVDIYTPKLGDTLNANASQELYFRWYASDPDGSPLLFQFEIWDTLGFLEKIDSINQYSFYLNHPLESGRKYFWRITAQDKLGSKDTSEIFTFQTQQSWNVPWALAGNCSFSSGSNYSEYQVQLQVGSGEVFVTPVDSLGYFEFFPGALQDSVLLWQTHLPTNTQSDTIQVWLDSTQGIYLGSLWSSYATP